MLILLIMPLLLSLIAFSSSEDDLLSSSSSPSSASSFSSASSSSIENSPTNINDDHPTIMEAMCSLDLLNYSVSSCGLLLTSLYDYNVDYAYSLKDNVKILYHYLVARFIALFLPSGSIDNDNLIVTTSYLSWPAFGYYLYQLQTLLFRTETIAFCCLFGIVAVIVNSQFNHYRERHSAAEPPLVPLPAPLYTPITPPKSPLSKLFNCFNFTIIFAAFFAIVDATLRNFRSSENVTAQQCAGNAGLYSIQGRRPNMEDCFTMKNNISQELGIDYYAVYDGHGGPNAALRSEKEIFDGLLSRIKEILSDPKCKDKSDSQCTAENSVSSSPKSVPTTFPAHSSSSPSSFISSFTPNLKSCPSYAGNLHNTNKYSKLTISAIKNILHEEITSVDKRLVEAFRKKGDISGTTALIAVRLIHSNTLLVANVGDSRAILCDWKGSTIPLSFDHKPYQLKEYRRIVEAGGYITLKGVYRVNGVLAVSRALGDYPLKEGRLVIPDPDILSFDLKELKPRFMVMASDGFWDTFSNENAVRFVRSELVRYPNYNCNNPDGSNCNMALAIAKKLVNEAYTRESYDNITVIVVLFEDCSSPNGKITTTTKIGQASSAASSNTKTTSSIYHQSTSSSNTNVPTTTTTTSSISITSSS